MGGENSCGPTVLKIVDGYREKREALKIVDGYGEKREVLKPVHGFEDRARCWRFDPFHTIETVVE